MMGLRRSAHDSPLRPRQLRHRFSREHSPHDISCHGLSDALAAAARHQLKVAVSVIVIGPYVVPPQVTEAVRVPSP